MKNNTIKKIAFYTLTTFFLYSCEQSEIIETEVVDDITSEIQKIETIYQKGDIKIENDTSREKVETIASSDLMKEIHGNLEKSYSKVTTAAKASGLYIGQWGVFMGSGGSCGSNRTLDVFMDCEDSRPATSASGYTGASRLVGRNVLLRFCVVNNSFSGNTYDKDFGILFLDNYGYNALKGSVVTRHFDNEDRRNTNYTKLNGSNISTRLGTNTHTILGEANTRLTFHIYYKYRYGTGAAFPNLGFSYGLLGSFGSGNTNSGNIFLDDEDSRNANYCYFKEYNPVSDSYIAGRYVSNSIPDFMDVGRNTRLKISKAR
jgi:hypothetical protein